MEPTPASSAAADSSSCAETTTNDITDHPTPERTNTTPTGIRRRVTINETQMLAV
ncbi:hypothetical protein MMEU_3494 [Mycobacterium marinum str. Europe]|nr:hypothetical protein MMEU_3494 [Mycobacterium marinum str. Europe]